jgi:hypothetical protein
MQVHENYSLRKYNTLGVPAVAKHFATFFPKKNWKNALKKTNPFYQK